ncbi:MAG TPA: hypothetical protein VHP62_01950 [Usitatibacter sp.]|jgi:hypothetical protein|nr:hypothetical protein [Usitatibacter sp.]
MTDEELQAIRARHQHDHVEDGGVACPWCEQDVPALLAEVERLKAALTTAYNEGWESCCDRALATMPEREEARRDATITAILNGS